MPPCRLTLLYLGLDDGGGDSSSSSGGGSGGGCAQQQRPSALLQLLNGLYLASSRGLAGVQQLGLSLALPVAAGERHQAFGGYQHLFQERGFVGASHACGGGGGGCSSRVCQLGLVRGGGGED